MYDLHTHTLLSDGEMLPIELARRASVLGYSTLGIADHADESNLAQVIRALMATREAAGDFGVELLCAVELTHVPPARIVSLARRARAEGAELVVVHGETLVEPVAPGTNHVAVASGEVDLLAHPGLLSREDAALAAANGTALELTSRAGHNRANGHVATVARSAGAMLVVCSDAHGPEDLLDGRARRNVALGAGLTEKEADIALNLNIGAWLGRRG